MSKVGVMIFPEGDFDGVYVFDSAAEARAFKEGATTGASKYGGSCAAYCSPADEEETEIFCEHIAEGERAKALAKLREAIETGKRYAR